MGDRVVIDGGEVSLTSQIDGGDVALTNSYDGGEIGQMYVPLPLISIGEVETLPPDEEATATMTGTASRPVLNLGIVRGQTGERGPQGIQGDTGSQGPKGDTGTAAGFGTVSATVDANVGTPSVSVTASGSDTAKNFAFEFHNLKGATGPQGPQGDPATNIITSVNGKTGAVVLGASDVGALPSSTTIPTKVSDLTNDSGFIDGVTSREIAIDAIDDYANGSANVAIISTWGEGNAALVTVEGDPIGFQDFYTEYSQNGKILVAWMIGEVSFIMFDVTAANADNGTVQLSSIVDETLYVVRLTDSGNGLVGTYSSVTLPTKVSDLTNDSGYLTLSTLPIWDGSVT